MPRLRARPGWRLGNVAAVMLVAAIGLLVPSEHVLPTLLSDSYMTLSSGRWIAAHGVPTHEVFTVAAHARPWIDQQWLAQLTDYEAWRIGGFAGVVVISACALSAAFAGVAGLVIRRGASPLIAAALAVLALGVTLPSMFVRAQAFAFPLFVFVLSVCLSDAPRWGARPRRSLLALIPLLAVWANVHGSVLLGAAISATYLGARAAERGARQDWASCAGCALLAVCAVLCIAATPYGFGIVHYYREVIGNSAIAAAAPEWRTPALGSYPFWTLVLLGTPLAATAVALIWRREHSASRLFPLLAALACAAASITASRNGTWFALTAIIVIADGGRDWVPTAPLARRVALALCGLSLALVAATVALVTARPSSWYERLTPVSALRAAGRYAAHHPCARVLADNVSSSALLWHDPALDGRIGFDARLEMYPPSQLRRWIAFQQAGGAQWARTMDGYAVFVSARTYTPALTQRLSRDGGLRSLVRSSTGVAMARRGGC